MGRVEPAALRGELRDALTGLSAEQCSNVIKLPAGYAILKVLQADEVANLENRERAHQAALAGRKLVHYSFDISGLSESESAWNAFPKPEHWEQDLRQSCEIRQQSLTDVSERLNRLLDAAQSSPKGEKQLNDLMALRVAKGQVYAYKGEMDEAIGQWEQV